MSDFVNSFWPLLIAGITLAGIFGCLVLLWISGTTKAHTAEDNSTGHVWDGDLRELNNPLPRWWVGMFIITCIFGLAYLYLYPGLGTYQGSYGWTQIKQFEDEVKQGNEQSAPIYASFAGKTAEELSKNPEAMAIGDRLFMNNCAQCHSSDAKGSKGFPNLTDTHWTWGGTPAEIHETITNGRTGVMTPMVAAVGSAEDVDNLANYVMSLSNGPHDAAKAALGQPKFMVCAACHGADGKGTKAVGAPDLTRGIFIHGPAIKEHVADMINNGKTGVMPAWGQKFTPEQLNVLTAYVWGRGGGVKEEPAPAPAKAAAEPTVSVEGGVVKFFFTSGSAELAANANEALSEVITGVNDGKTAIISGYVDQTGNAAQNEELSKQRAQAVKERLVSLGLPEDKIQLRKPEDIDAGQGMQARRVEVTLE